MSKKETPCKDCVSIQAKAREYDTLKNWLLKSRRLANIKEYREVYDHLLKQFKKSDKIIEVESASSIVLVCPKCSKPFCIEPNAESLAETLENVEAMGAAGIQCVFCHHRFKFEEARYIK